LKRLGYYLNHVGYKISKISDRGQFLY